MQNALPITDFTLNGPWELECKFLKGVIFQAFFSFLDHQHPKTCLLHFQEDIFNQGPLKQKDRIAQNGPTYCRIIQNL